MRVMAGWTIDWTDAVIGVGLLLAITLVAFACHVAREIALFDLSVDENREETQGGGPC